MITPEEIYKKAVYQFSSFLDWKAEQILKTAYSENNADIHNDFFPLVIKGSKGSASKDLVSRMNEVAPLIAESKQKNKKRIGYSLDFEQINTRTNGMQTVIKNIYFETENDFLHFIKKESATQNFVSAIKILNSELQLEKQQNSTVKINFNLEWIHSHHSDLCDSHSDETNFWHSVCLCVNYLFQNTSSNLYLRQLPVKVHTKFIESNKALIQSLLAVTESDISDSTEENKKTSFESKYGIKEKPVLVRFRSLDKKILLNVNSLQVSEMILPLCDFESFDKSDLFSRIKRIFIIENEMVYLSFPEVADSICIWGHGFTATVFKSCSWFNKKNIFYFGDLDEHGFLILSDFRKYFPLTKSFCMDSRTLKTFDSFRSKGKSLSGNFIPQNLTEEEKLVFTELHNSVSNNGDRLEQEHISNDYIEDALWDVE